MFDAVNEETLEDMNEETFEDIEYLNEEEFCPEIENPVKVQSATKKLKLPATQTSYLEEETIKTLPSRNLNRRLSATPKASSKTTSSKTPTLFTPRPPVVKFRTIVTPPDIPENDKENSDETELLKGCLNMLENKEPMDDIDHFCASLSGQIRRCNMSQANKARVFQNLQHTLAEFIINNLSEY